MNALVRFGLLLLAILLIPWLAANPPAWPSSVSSQDLQGWGAVAAVLAGFAYVGFQRWLDRRAERDRRRRMILHLLQMSRSGAGDAYQRIDKFEHAASVKGGQIRTLYGRDLLHEIADEMMAVRIDDIGSPEVLTEVRRVAFALRAFAHVCTTYDAKPLDEAALKDLLEFRDSLLGAVMGFHRACGATGPVELFNGTKLRWGEAL